MAARKPKIDPATRPPLKLQSGFSTDSFLMYHLQSVTKLPTSEILGFFADLGRSVAEEGVHFMYEKGTSSMKKEIFDFFPGTSVPFALIITGGKHYYKRGEEEVEGEVSDKIRRGSYHAAVGFPDCRESIDQTELSNIIMEKAILGGCEMAPFEKPDPRCPKMYKDLMKQVQSRRMV